MQDFHKLRVWQQAQELCVEIYRFTSDFPREERYGVTGQVRRSAVAVGSNIAEGSRRASQVDKARVINIGESEGAEVESLLDLSERLKFGNRAVGRELMRRYDSLGGQIETLRQRILDAR
jgi:four helix bundle protein